MNWSFQRPSVRTRSGPKAGVLAPFRGRNDVGILTFGRTQIRAIQSGPREFKSAGSIPGTVRIQALMNRIAVEEVSRWRSSDEAGVRRTQRSRDSSPGKGSLPLKAYRGL